MNRINPTKSVIFGILAICIIPLVGAVYAEPVGEGAKLIGSEKMNEDGYTGYGVKVAIFAEKFDESNEVIAGNVSKYVPQNLGIDDTIGTASAEVIIDIAPDVELYLYETISNDDFTRAINDVKQNEIRIILTALIQYNDKGPLNGESFLSDMAKSARADGILWISPAGDAAEIHWGGYFTPDSSGTTHLFGNRGNTQNLPFKVNDNDSFKAILSWDDWHITNNANSVNYGLVVDDLWGDRIVDKIQYRNGHPAPPVEIAEFDALDIKSRVPVENEEDEEDTEEDKFRDIDYVCAELNITRDRSTPIRNMHLFILTHDIIEDPCPDPRIEDEEVIYDHPTILPTPRSSILIPGDSPGALTVGAVSLEDELESFSSQGPTDDGRIKPDVVAPNAVSTTALKPFSGTISAASHVAGMSALIQDKFPNATPHIIQTMIEYTTAKYNEKTNLNGTGRVDLRMFSADIISLDVNNNCDVCFYPRNHTINVGDIITWINAGQSPLNFTIKDDKGNITFDDVVQPGESCPHLFNYSGVFTYSDSSYPNITGTITVLAVPIPPGIISGVIFSDINNNDTQDIGEIGIPNVVISINSLTDTTDNMGAYSIDIIPPGTYTISFDMPDGYSGESSKDITIISGNNELNFALSPDPIATGGIAGNIFSDDNSNGVRDPLEEGISTKISILDTYHSTISKINGNYSFPSIPIGNYQLKVTIPSGYSADVNTKPVSVQRYQNGIVNFAMTPDPVINSPNSIHGIIFSDDNGNGSQDAGESGIADYTMMALDGQNVFYDITDKNGRYSFDVIPGVSYLIQTQFFPQGHVVYDEKSSWFRYISVPAGESISFDIGFQPVRVKDLIELELNFYLDENFNRQYDSGESAISIPDDMIVFYTYTYTIGPVSNIISDTSGRSTSSLVPADFAVLANVENLKSLGYSWAATEYERTDDKSVEYDYYTPVGNDPAPGSRHVMYVGLWEN